MLTVMILTQAQLMASMTNVSRAPDCPTVDSVSSNSKLSERKRT